MKPHLDRRNNYTTEPNLSLIRHIHMSC